MGLGRPKVVRSPEPAAPDVAPVIAAVEAASAPGLSRPTSATPMTTMAGSSSNRRLLVVTAVVVFPVISPISGGRGN
jgi:hypothetical protein